MRGRVAVPTNPPEVGVVKSDGAESTSGLAEVTWCRRSSGVQNEARQKLLLSATLSHQVSWQRDDVIGHLAA